MLGSIVLLLTLASAPASAPDSVAELERELAAHPEDVDRMVQLAHALARGGERTRARALAQSIIERAPDYWDAHLLLARLDAWESAYDASLERLDAVLSQVPFLKEALHLKAQVQLWAGALTDSRTTLLDLLARDESADAYHRLAQVEYERMHYWAAWQAASRALELNPLHGAARALRDEIVLVRADVVMELEHLPIDGLEFAEAQLISVTLLPAAFLSFTLTEELRYRFGAWNQFLQGQIDHRFNRRVRAGALAGFGAPSPAISKVAASLWLGVEIAGPLDARLAYRYDRVGLPGDLHRISLDAGVRLPASFRAELGYSLGLLSAMEPGVLDLHGLRARLAFEPSRFGAHIEYAFGSQVDRPIVGLAELDTHDLSLGLRVRVQRWLELLGGFGLQFRQSVTASGEAVRGSLGARVSI